MDARSPAATHRDRVAIDGFAATYRAIASALGDKRLGDAVFAARPDEFGFGLDAQAGLARLLRPFALLIPWIGDHRNRDARLGEFERRAIGRIMRGGDKNAPEIGR